MKSVINYALSRCTQCLKCLRTCPMGAISINQERVSIDDNKCINCGICIEQCTFQGLKANGSTLHDLANYNYKVALIPSAIYSSCKNTLEVEELFRAIKDIGFNEVVDMSAIEGAIADEVLNQINNSNTRGLISSFCPVVNRLIEVKYPMLLDKMVDIDYPNEIAAKIIRKKFSHIPDVGIFYFCECVSRLRFAKYPYGNKESAIDHALSLEDCFPIINRNRQIQSKTRQISKKGLKSCSMLLNFEDVKILHADGISKLTKVLELTEFGQMQRFEYLSCSYCTNGCIGGNLLWGNPFDARLNIEQLIAETQDIPMTLKDIDLKRKQFNESKKSLSIQQRIQYFAEVNKVVEVLPQFDCGACGFASCRQMAEQIVSKNREVVDCRVFEYRRKSK